MRGPALRSFTAGEVFNLKKLSDFSGNYVAGAAGIAVAGGVNDVIMKNEHGVVLRLHGTEKGVKLTLGPQGVKINLNKTERSSAGAP